MPSKNKNQNKKRNNKQSQELVVRKTTVVSQPNTSGRGRRAGRRAKRSNRRFQNLTEYFEKYLRYPDLMGPLRVPRPMSGARTVLGRDRTIWEFIGGASFGAQGIQMGTGYNGTVLGLNFGNFSAVDTSTAFTWSAVARTVGIQFPTLATVEDASLVSGDILISLVGTVTAATGQILMGSGPSIKADTTVTWNNLMYYPGARWFPVTDLLKGPLRVSLRHLSPVSWEFKDPGVSVEDIDTPFILVTGLPANCTIRAELTRNWEVRSVMGTGAIPYETIGTSLSNEVSAFEDAVSHIASKVTDITELVPDEIKDAAKDIAVSAGISFMNSAAQSFGLSGVHPESMMHAVHNYHAQNIEKTNRPALKYHKDEL